MIRNVMCIGMISAVAVCAQGKAGIGLGVYTPNINLFDASTAKGQFKQTPELNFRYYMPEHNFGLDLFLGGALDQGTLNDSTTKTVGDPGSHVFTGEIGTFFKLLGNDNGYFGIDGTLGLSIQRWADFDKPKPATAYAGFATYTMYIPYFSLNLEPGYFFNPNFSLYTHFGFNVVYFPPSQYIDNTDASYNPATRTFPLKNRQDDNTSFSMAQMGIGIRYFL